MQAAVVGAVAVVLARRAPRSVPVAAQPGSAGQVAAEQSGKTAPIDAAATRPWLLGEGRWLAIALVCLAVIGALAAVLPERPAVREPTEVAPPPPPLRAAPPQQALPSGAAAPIAPDEGTWVTPDDYPADAIRTEEEGAVRIRWVIGADGTVSDCGVVRSSGHTRLDHAACDAIMHRARYRPARDAAGWPIAITRERTVRWVLPQE